MRNQLAERITLLLNSSKLPWAIISIGIILRAVQYLFNRSLWLDESYLALNIIERSFFELLQPLSYNQGAPIGFLMVEKVVVKLFGGNEYSLRFLPFLSGVISLFIFYKLGKKFIKPKAVLIGLGLLTISGSLIYYSSEVKQYSSDVVIALMLYWMTDYIQSKELNNRIVLLYGVLGGIALWLSYPSVFVLAGSAVTLTYFSVTKKEWVKIRGLSFAYLIWVVSFIFYYFISLNKLGSNELLLKYWHGAFMPFPPMSLSDAKWYVHTFFKVFNDPVNMQLYGIAALAFLVGCISLFRERKDKFYLLILPIIFTLLASSLRKYPFSGRLILFLVPSLLILIAEGASQIWDRTKNGYKFIGIVFIGLLFLHPINNAVDGLFKPYREETRTVLDYVERNQKNGDVLYLYYFTIKPFKYYSDRYNFRNINCIQGMRPTTDWNSLVNDFNKLRGNKRVWILFSSTQDPIGVDVDKFSLYYLDTIGKKLDSFKSAGAAAYLYDLSEEPAL